MIPTYENYLKEKQSLTFEEMQHIHAAMTDNIESDKDALELYHELVHASVKYACLRTKWPMLSRQEKTEQDAGRTALHDSLIVKFNKFARYLKMTGKETAWREALGDESSNIYVRKRIGDFACWLAFINGLYAR